MFIMNWYFKGGGEGKKVQEAIYLDSAFLLNLVMDLYLLKLTAKILGKTATFSRLLAGSLTGTAVYCLILCLPGIPRSVKMTAGMLATGALMIKIGCRTKGIKQLIRAMGYLYLFSFLLGGFLLFVKARLSQNAGRIWEQHEGKILCILFLSFFLETLLEAVIHKSRERKKKLFCEVKLKGDQGPLEVKALVDTGNGLRDPISGKPVALLDQKIWEDMKSMQRPERYKLIPYHSIGRKNGMLEGYEVDQVEIWGIEEKKQLEHVIIAVCREELSGTGSYQMILPPELAL